MNFRWKNWLVIVAIAIVLVTLGAQCAKGQIVEGPSRNQILARQIAERARQQQAIIDEQQAQLNDSRNTADALWNELTATQPKINKVAEERDGWRNYAHDREVAALKAAKSMWFWRFICGVMSTGIAAYLFLKFYLRFPI